MNATQLLAHFDRLAEAPNAVPRLRRFILDLAVRGKLVEQDAGDEPASALLEQIESEVARLLKIGEMRKPKALPPVEVEDEPFDAPSGWRWVRIRQVTSDRGQTTPVGEFTYIDVGSINKEAGILGTHKVLSASNAPSRARKVVAKGDVLYSCVRPTLLNIAVVDDEITPTPIASTAFAVLNSFGLVLPRYIWITLRSPYLEAIVESGMRGQAYPAINDAEFAMLPLALPPLAEQHRIVAKVDELMALCDQLEAAQQERERRRDRLAAASLQRLNQSALDATAEAQREHARFHLQNLPRLTTRPEHIKAMRQTILNLAVRGKLVEQHAGDEPATELLKRIRAEKAALTKAGKLKRGTEDAPASDAEPPFMLPMNWVWAQLGEVAQYGIPDKVDSNAAIPTNTWVLDLEDIEKDTSRLLNQVESEARPFNSTKTAFKQGDVLFGKLRPYLNKVIVADRDGVCTTEIIPIRGYCGLSPEYTKLVLRSPMTMSTVDRLMYGMKMPRLGTADATTLSYPLAPLAEQHRIVAKVDELMALCDRLDAQLKITQTDSQRLLDAVLDAALGIARMPLDLPADISRSPSLKADLHIGEASRAMTTNPAITVDQLMECIDDLGGSASPERLLKQAGLGEDVEVFYDLLRAARDSGKVTAPLGGGEIVRRQSNAN